MTLPPPPPVLIQPSPPAAPSAWWARPGAPTLKPIETILYGRYGIAYVEVTYFVDPVTLRRRAGASLGAAALKALREGKVWCATRVKFLEGASQAKRQEFLLNNLRTYWPGGAFDPEGGEVKAYVAYNARLLNQQDTVEYLFTPRGEVWVAFRAEPARCFTHPRVAGAVRAFEWSDQAGNPEAQARLGAALERVLKAP